MARIAGVARAITPAAELRMLAVDDEVQSLLRRLTQRRVFRQAIRFAQSDRRHAVAVEPHELALVREEIAVRLLMLDVPLHRAINDRLMRTRLMRVARTEERQQRQAGRCRVRMEAAVPGAFVVLATELVNAPVTVRVLMLSQPSQPTFDRLLGCVRSTERLRRFFA